MCNTGGFITKKLKKLQITHILYQHFSSVTSMHQMYFYNYCFKF